MIKTILYLSIFAMLSCTSASNRQSTKTQNYCDCLRSTASKSIDQFDKILVKIAADNLISGQELTSALKTWRLNGLPEDINENNLSSRIEDFINASKICSRVHPSAVIEEKMSSIVDSIEPELSSLYEKVTEIFTLNELNSCRVKYNILVIFLLRHIHTGVQVTIPDVAYENALSSKVSINITFVNDKPEIYINDSQFKLINLVTEKIDRSAFQKEIELQHRQENIVIELRADRKVSYLWPAQVIDIAKENEWKIILVYEQD